MTSFVGDICEPTADVLQKAFEGVDCVFHCAALVDLQFPPRERELERVNVNGKETIFFSTLYFTVPRHLFFPHSVVFTQSSSSRLITVIIIREIEVAGWARRRET